MKLILLFAFIFTLFLTGCGVSQAEYDKINSLCTQLILEKSQLEYDYEELNTQYNELEIKNEELRNELLRPHLPPRHFYDRTELSYWRDKHGLIGINHGYIDSCLQMQQLALEDGLILSLDIDDGGDSWELSLTALAGDKFYQLYPGDLEIYYICDID